MGITCTDRCAKTNTSQNHARGENTLNQVIDIDEARIWDFNPELKSQSNFWMLQTSLRPKKFCSSKSKEKQMMIFAYDKDGIIATDQVPNGITATATHDQKFIRSVLRPQIWKLQPKKTDSGVSIPHNAHQHVAQPVVDLFIDYTRETFCHPLWASIWVHLTLTFFQN